MRLLIIVIYSEAPEYEDMLKLQRSYLNRFENVSSFFVTHREHQMNLIDIKDDFIYVKGKEEYLQITHKTIRAFEYALKNVEFDYAIRTNISTVINIPELQKYCSTLPKHHVYTSGCMLTLDALNEPFGIVDTSLFGTVYASGTSIILSKDLVQRLVQFQRFIRYDVIDDVAIGHFISKYASNSYYDRLAKWTIVTDHFHFDKSTVFYRNRSSTDRLVDAKHMKEIIHILYAFEKEGFTLSNWSDDWWTLYLCIAFGTLVVSIITAK
uniref:Glycosyltransferase n=1 Tax=viral metagenome TaxID=1070528 RepID=A0A6C0I2T0_9ZZZZ